MNLHRRSRGACALAAVALAALLAADARAQDQPSGLPSPRLYQVHPAGAKAGTTVEVVVAGRHLEEAQRLAFSTPGIKAEFVPPPAPVIDPKTKKPKPVSGALPPDLYKFKITVPANVPLGMHDMRVVNKWGVSNPRTFVVGDQTEVLEKEPNNNTTQPQKVELNSTVNGTIGSPTDVDYYTVSVKKGQRVVVACLASAIDSRLQPGVEVYDKDDRQIAANRHYRGDNAVTDFTASEDGDYQIRLYQFTHTFRQAIPGNVPNGSSDYFYRLNITTAPWIDSVVPNVVEPGKTVSVTVYGRNLPNGKPDPSATADDSVLDKITMNVTAPADGRGKMMFSGNVPPATGWVDGFEVRVKNAAGTSNPYLIGLARAPVVMESGQNGTPETAQAVTLPCEIAGVVEKRRDRDWFSFNAKKGDTWNIEVFSHRLGAPTFMSILLRNPATKADIYESPLQENMNLLPRKFFSRTEDPPKYRFTAPADGTYQLLVASRAGDTLYGARHTYSVRITRDDPEFSLVAISFEGSTPDVASLPAGGQTAFTVLIDREEPFNEDVTLTVEGLPAGVVCAPQVLSRGVRQTTISISAPDNAPAWSGHVKVKGTATYKGKQIVREARPAGLVWPKLFNQNIPTISRLEQSLWLAVAGKVPFTLTPTLNKAVVKEGEKDAVLKVAIKRLWPDIKGLIQVRVMQPQQRQGSELPIQLRFNNNQPLTVNANQNETTLKITIGNNVPPGTYNVVLRGQTQIKYNKDPKAKQKQNIFVVMPSLPVSITVLPKELAKMQITPNQQNVKVGGMGKVSIRLNRLYDFDGEFKVQLVLPNNVKGIEAPEITIPAGQSSGELLVKVPAGAPPGNRANLIVRATAVFDGKTPVIHESKININVVK